MQRLKTALVCALLAILGLVGIQAYLLLRAATQAAKALPAAVLTEVHGDIQNLRVDLAAQVATTRRDTLALVDRQATALQGNAMTAIREQGATANAQIAAALSLVDRRVGDTLARVDTGLTDLGALESAAKPVLANSAALVKDLQDSLDANYDDLHATIASSTVAVTGVARAAEAVGNAAPSITSSFDSMAKSGAREADALTKPPTFWSGVRTWLAVISRTLALAF